MNIATPIITMFTGMPTGIAVHALIWRPFTQPSVIGIVGVALAALAVWVAARAPRDRRAAVVAVTVMRLTLIAGLVALLMGPSTLPPSSQRPDRPVVTLLLDTSASMQTPDIDGQSRIAFACSRWLDRDLIERLGREFNVRLMAFDSAARRLPMNAAAGTIEAIGATTQVTASVHQAILETPQESRGSSVVVISDGRDSTDRRIEPVTLQARGRGVAIHSVVVGGARARADVAVAAALSQGYLLVNEEGQVVVSVYQIGADGGGTRVRLKGPGGEAVRDVRFEGRSSVQVSIPVKESSPGQYEYRVTADPLEGEVERSNNTQSVFIEVMPSRMRVLLIEGEPNWDTKFLAQSLRRDERIELTQVSQVTELRRETIVSRGEAAADKLPATLDELRRYDAVILGRSVENVMPAPLAALLPAYVSERGGRVLLARGRPSTTSTERGRRIDRTLSVLSPVELGVGEMRGVRLWPTGEGWDHPCFDAGRSADGTPASAQAVRSLPEIGSAARVLSVKPAATVLAKAQAAVGGQAGREESPAVVTMPYGGGLVAAVYVDGLWRWSLGARGVREKAGVFDRFWSNMVRWLVLGSDLKAGEAVSLRPSRRNVQVGEVVRFDVAARDAAVAQRLTAMEVVDPAGGRQSLALTDDASHGDRRIARFTPMMMGNHLARVKDPTADRWIEASFNANTVDRERLFAAADPHRLRALSEGSGGVVLDRDHPEALLAALRRQESFTRTDPQPVYVWDRAWLLTALLVWAGAEWITRRTGGML
ncbi:MAG: hypothetical protein K8S99_15880 [Planctomycetes bacterium]|nr:hypothetical protein [Planctomycetota bacterium]